MCDACHERVEHFDQLWENTEGQVGQFVLTSICMTHWFIDLPKGLFTISYREGVMEFLLANHPLDCPICDQGGECDLQVGII